MPQYETEKPEVIETWYRLAGSFKRPFKLAPTTRMPGATYCAVFCIYRIQVTRRRFLSFVSCRSRSYTCGAIWNWEAWGDSKKCLQLDNLAPCQWLDTDRETLAGSFKRGQLECLEPLTSKLVLFCHYHDHRDRYPYHGSLIIDYPWIRTLQVVQQRRVLIPILLPILSSPYDYWNIFYLWPVIAART